MATSDARDQLQTALGAQYTLARELGRGGMATVYLAQDTKHHRSVALKVLHPELRAALLGFGFLIGVGALFAWRRHVGAAPVTVAGGPVGLAVLPFDNEGDTANAYFADGITDEIRSKLSAVPALRLIASASSNQYRHTQKPAEQIGRELGVRYLHAVLSGRTHHVPKLVQRPRCRQRHDQE